MNDGIHFLLNVKDLYSKFAWSIPLKNKSCAVIAERLENLFFIEGMVEVLQSDNGQEFLGSDMVEMCFRNKIKFVHSLPYSSSTQGSVEKFNSTVRSLIHQFQVNFQRNRYIDHLPFLIYSYNTDKHSTTGYTPFQSFRKKDEKYVLSNLINKVKKQEITLPKPRKQEETIITTTKPLQVLSFFGNFRYDRV